MIQTYFNQLEAAFTQFTAVSFVLESAIHLEPRPGNQGYVYGTVMFTDQSRFFFREYLDVAAGKIEKVMYTYHYQDAANQLLFRYDNAQHKPALLFSEHKHMGDTDIIQADAPLLSDVLLEIAQMRGWV